MPENCAFPQLQERVNITIQQECEASNLGMSNTVQKSLNFQFLQKWIHSRGPILDLSIQSSQSTRSLYLGGCKGKKVILKKMSLQK
jgi:hypothetical protein